MDRYFGVKYPAYHLRFDKLFEGKDVTILLAFHELDLTKCPLSNNLDCSVV